MNVLHVITGLQKAAGTSVFCGEVANELVAMGHAVTIAVCDPNQSDLYPLDPRVKLVSIDSILHSSTSTPDFNLIHIHALWSPFLHKLAKWARGNRIPIVWSPHGMITPWAMKNKRLKKLLGWYLYQKRDLQSASLLHATAQSEVEDIRRMGLKNKVVVAPLGVRIEKSKLRVEVEERNGKTLLFVSRVQRKKGLPMLLEAWARLRKSKCEVEVEERTSKPITDGWKIRIVGPDEGGHVAELMAQCDRLGLSYSTPDGEVKVKGQGQEWNCHHSPTPTLNSNSIRPEVEFVGPKFGDDLTREYASADLFVLPTHSENFGSVVIESLAQCVPVICTKGAPWKELETHHCGIWCDIGVKSLAIALAELLPCPDSRLEVLGCNGLQLVREKYTWRAVAEAIVNGYKKVCEI